MEEKDLAFGISSQQMFLNNSLWNQNLNESFISIIISFAYKINQINNIPLIINLNL